MGYTGECVQHESFLAAVQHLGIPIKEYGPTDTTRSKWRPPSPEIICQEIITNNMSRHFIIPRNPGHEVIVGWDVPLDTYFQGVEDRVDFIDF